MITWGGEGVTQMIANDHRGEGGVWEGPKYDRAILEQLLSKICPKIAKLQLL